MRDRHAANRSEDLGLSLCFGGVGDAIAGAVTGPIETFKDAVEKVVTEPDKLTLGDAVSAAIPIGGSLVVDAVKHPEHAAVQGAVVGSAIGLNSLAASRGLVGGGTFAAPWAPAASVGNTAAAASGGGGFFQTLQTVGLVGALTQAGQKAQSFLGLIPGAERQAADAARGVLLEEARKRGEDPGTVPSFGLSPFAATPAIIIIGGLALVGVSAWWVWTRWLSPKRKAA